jgi:putative PIN family toxin of toxin-antitoxin system
MKRPHIVLDTNVLVSALLFGGPPREILNMIVAGIVNCSLSLPILEELQDVLRCPKFGFSSPLAMAIAEDLSALCTIANPLERISVISADPDDNRILECALEARAGLIISGDGHLLDLREYEGIRIVNPSEFLQMVRERTPTPKGRQERKR